jgi:hypothetical protein
MRRERVRRALASASALLLAALIPKCPLCLAAALSTLGLGATVGSTLAPWLRPVALGLSVLAVLGVARAEWRRRRDTVRP